MTILIADGHKMVRMGLSMIVSSEIPGADISEAGNASEVLKVLKQKI